jgi:hypothetical protein
MRRADEIIVALNEWRKEHGSQEALRLAWEQFVEGEKDVDLRRVSEAVADARRQAMIQRQLDDDRERLHHEAMSHEQHLGVGQHYDMLRREACTYNHSLRGLIEKYAGEVEQREVIEWLIEASFGARDWAVAEVSGAVSEIALHAALADMPELSGVRHATVDEDLAGYDFVADWGGQPLTIDAKTGMYPPLTLRKRGHRHLEISVPRGSVRHLRLTNEGLELLLREIREALAVPAGQVSTPRRRNVQHWGRHAAQHGGRQTHRGGPARRYHRNGRR